MAPFGGSVPDPRKPEHACPSCGSEVALEATACPNCGAAINSNVSSTGNFTNYTPDPRKPKTINPTKNVQLSSVLMFDSKTQKFFVTSSTEEGDIEEIERRKKEHPDLELVERDIYKSKVFDSKGMRRPHADKYKGMEISKSMDDLAIDG